MAVPIGRELLPVPEQAVSKVQTTLKKIVKITAVLGVGTLFASVTNVAIMISVDVVASSVYKAVIDCSMAILPVSMAHTQVAIFNIINKFVFPSSLIVAGYYGTKVGHKMAMLTYKTWID